MNIKRILPWAILGLIALFIFSSIGRYNDLVAKDESINGQWAQVEAAYQRRADLIPILVKTVKGYADFEKETLTQVIEARSKATSVQIDANDLNMIHAKISAGSGRSDGHALPPVGLQ